MEVSNLPLFRKRLSLAYSSPDSTSPVFCYMFVDTIASRITKDLKWASPKSPKDTEKIVLLLEQQTARMALSDAIENAFASSEPGLPKKLAEEALQEFTKMPEFLKSHYKRDTPPALIVRRLNHVLDGLSALYARIVPDGLLEAAPKATFLYASLVPRIFIRDEKCKSNKAFSPSYTTTLLTSSLGLEERLKIFRYRFEFMEMVDRYSDFLQIPLPNGKTCREFDNDNIKINNKCNLSSDYETWRTLRLCEIGADFFPLPLRAGMIHFGRPIQYFEAARQNSGLSLNEFCERMTLLTKAFNEELGRSIEWLQSIPEVRARICDVFRLCGAEFGLFETRDCLVSA